MKISKQQALDFAILALRWYLAFYMFSYGMGKLTTGQFGLYDPKIAEQPMKDIDPFYIAWYLFDNKMFEWATGLGEILGAALIVFNRTAIVGALVLLPLIFTIWLIDLCFTTQLHGLGLVMRLSMMLLADVAILLYHKEKLLQAWRWLTEPRSMQLKYKWWVYALMPAVGFLMDFVQAVVGIPFRMIFNFFK